MGHKQNFLVESQRLRLNLISVKEVWLLSSGGPKFHPHIKASWEVAGQLDYSEHLNSSSLESPSDPRKVGETCRNSEEHMHRGPTWAEWSNFNNAEASLGTLSSCMGQWPPWPLSGLWVTCARPQSWFKPRQAGSQDSTPTLRLSSHCGGRSCWAVPTDPLLTGHVRYHAKHSSCLIHPNQRATHGCRGYDEERLEEPKAQRSEGTEPGYIEEEQNWNWNPDLPNAKVSPLHCFCF